MRISDWSSDVCSSDLSLFERCVLALQAFDPFVERRGFFFTVDYALCNHKRVSFALMSAGFRLSFVLVWPNVHPQGLIMDYGNGFSRDCHSAVGINSPAIGIRGPCLRKTASSSASAALPGI